MNPYQNIPLSVRKQLEAALDVDPSHRPITQAPTTDDDDDFESSSSSESEEEEESDNSSSSESESEEEEEEQKSSSQLERERQEKLKQEKKEREERARKKQQEEDEGKVCGICGDTPKAYRERHFAVEDAQGNVHQPIAPAYGGIIDPEDTSEDGDYMTVCGACLQAYRRGKEKLTKLHRQEMGLNDQRRKLLTKLKHELADKRAAAIEKEEDAYRAEYAARGVPEDVTIVIKESEQKQKQQQQQQPKSQKPKSQATAPKQKKTAAVVDPVYVKYREEPYPKYHGNLSWSGPILVDAPYVRLRNKWGIALTELGVHGGFKELSAKEVRPEFEKIRKINAKIIEDSLKKDGELYFKKEDVESMKDVSGKESRFGGKPKPMEKLTVIPLLIGKDVFASKLFISYQEYLKKGGIPRPTAEDIEESKEYLAIKDDTGKSSIQYKHAVININNGNVSRPPVYVDYRKTPYPKYHGNLNWKGPVLVDSPDVKLKNRWGILTNSVYISDYSQGFIEIAGQDVRDEVQTIRNINAKIIEDSIKTDGHTFFNPEDVEIMKSLKGEYNRDPNISGSITTVPSFSARVGYQEKLYISYREFLRKGNVRPTQEEIEECKDYLTYDDLPNTPPPKRYTMPYSEPAQAISDYLKYEVSNDGYNGYEDEMVADDNAEANSEEDERKQNIVNDIPEYHVYISTGQSYPAYHGNRNWNGPILVDAPYAKMGGFWGVITDSPFDGAKPDAAKHFRKTDQKVKWEVRKIYRINWKTIQDMWNKDQYFTKQDLEKLNPRNFMDNFRQPDNSKDILPVIPSTLSKRDERLYMSYGEYLKNGKTVARPNEPQVSNNNNNNNNNNANIGPKTPIRAHKREQSPKNANTQIQPTQPVYHFSMATGEQEGIDDFMVVEHNDSNSSSMSPSSSYVPETIPRKDLTPRSNSNKTNALAANEAPLTPSQVILKYATPKKQDNNNNNNNTNLDETSFASQTFNNAVKHAEEQGYGDSLLYQPQDYILNQAAFYGESSSGHGGDVQMRDVTPPRSGGDKVPTPKLQREQHLKPSPASPFVPGTRSPTQTSRIVGITSRDEEYSQYVKAGVIPPRQDSNSSDSVIKSSSSSSSGSGSKHSLHHSPNRSPVSSSSSSSGSSSRSRSKKQRTSIMFDSNNNNNNNRSSASGQVNSDNVKTIPESEVEAKEIKQELLGYIRDPNTKMDLSEDDKMMNWFVSAVIRVRHNKPESEESTPQPKQPAQIFNQYHGAGFISLLDDSNSNNNNNNNNNKKKPTKKKPSTKKTAAPAKKTTTTTTTTTQTQSQPKSEKKRLFDFFAKL